MNDLFVGSSYDPSTTTCNIVFNDPSRAGETVTVTYSDGGDDERNVEIVLDDEGHGSADVSIPPNWISVLLEEPQSLDHTIAI